MTVRVAISEPRLLVDLARSLERCACSVRHLSDRAFEVTSVAGGDVAVARVELEFFLRAWSNDHPGVEVLVA
jgi:hypothetical protein